MSEKLLLNTADGLQGTFEIDAGVTPLLSEKLRQIMGMPRTAEPLPCRCKIHHLTTPNPTRLMPLSKYCQIALPCGNEPPEFYVGALEELPLESNVYVVKLGFFCGLLTSLFQQQLFLMHGGLARSPEGKGVLFSGPSGVGKSTASGKLLRAGWQLLADDFVLIGRQNGKWFAQGAPTYSSWRLEKPLVAPCQVNTIIPVDAVMILGRGDNTVTKLPPKQARLALSGAFADMVRWHVNFLRCASLRKKLISPLFQTIFELTSVLPAFHVANTLESDIAALFQRGLDSVSFSASSTASAALPE